MKTVLFVQLPPPRFSFETPPTNIHLAAGFMAAAMEASGMRHFRTSVIDPEVVDVFADQGLINWIVEKRPTVLALTLYVWNVVRSLFLASQIKQKLPEILILVGGPEVTPDNKWVLAHPAPDAGVFGEGESRIGSLIQALDASCTPETLPGIFFRQGRQMRLNQSSSPNWDLRSAPYPYLDGRIAPSRDGTIFLETVRGCPYRCRYCYYHKTFKEIRHHPFASVERVLDYAYDTESPVREIYLMDPTFNAAERFRTLLKTMALRRRDKEVVLHAELRADLLDSYDVALLKNAGLKSAEVGLQTVNPTALRKAGRPGNRSKTANGISLLKNEGIEVTTGIILGLPGDSPEGFQRTLDWLEHTGAFSVVHPFVLSVLPGTYFRAHASDLGLRYDMRPPYYVQSTASFTAGDLTTALHACEHVFQMELDHIGLPSLVDRGQAVIQSIDRTPYVSKWVIDVSRPHYSRWLPVVTPKATDPFTFWLRGYPSIGDESITLKLIEEFVHCNPHTCLHIVIECAEPPASTFLQQIIDTAANPAHFLNRSYRPLYREDELVTPSFTLVLLDPGNLRRRAQIKNRYLPLTSVVWNMVDPNKETLRSLETPALISWSRGETVQRLDDLCDALGTGNDFSQEGIYFRNSQLQGAWNRFHDHIGASSSLPEKIFISA